MSALVLFQCFSLASQANHLIPDGLSKQHDSVNIVLKIQNFMTGRFSLCLYFNFCAFGTQQVSNYANFATTTCHIVPVRCYHVVLRFVASKHVAADFCRLGLVKSTFFFNVLNQIYLYIFFRLPYYELVGGVFSINVHHFLLVNGYSNLYWGWGGEDDDMGYRYLG